MKNYLKATYLLLFLFSCQQKEKKSIFLESNNQLESFTFDSSRFVVLEYDSTFNHIFPENSAKTDISKKDLFISDSLLQKEVKKFNSIGQLRSDSLKRNFPKYQFDQEQFRIDLEEFKRQYVAVITLSGDRLIHINLFCESGGNEYWYKEYVNVNGGGNCFIQTTINITKKELIEFSINPII